jgi:hypothetical protein
MINARLFSNFSIVASDYKNSLEYNEEMQKYKWLTGVTDLNAKLDFSFYIKPESV